MPRTIQEIAADVRDAVTTIKASNAMMARTLGGMDISDQPAVTVKLPDGREIELGALADELVEAANQSPQ